MKADFAHKIKTDFFNEDERILMYLLNYELLELKFYSNKDSSIFFPFFQLDREKATYFQNDSIKLLGNVKDFYTTFEIEDKLLNHFEDLNLYRKNGIIGFDYLESGFAWYVEATFENSEIQKLLFWLNSEPDISESYTGFQELYYFFKDYKKK
jgi:hypothetical protein